MALNKDNMDEVKKDAETASTQEEVKKEGADASTAKEDELDMAEELVKSLEREVKLREERDNYKTGMLKAKGKLAEDDADDEEEVIVEKKTKDSSELVSVVKELLRRNKELETAVINKSQVSTAGQGAGSESSMKVGDNVLSADQIKELKSRGWDDTKIALFKKNLLKTRA